MIRIGVPTPHSAINGVTFTQWGVEFISLLFLDVPGYCYLPHTPIPSDSPDYIFQPYTFSGNFMALVLF